jgi:hypothetical protein
VNSICLNATADPILVSDISCSSGKDVYSKVRLVFVALDSPHHSSSQYIKPAKDGEVEAFFQLPEVVEHGPHHFVSDIVELYLANLDPALLPSGDDLIQDAPLALLVAKRAFFSLRGLWRYLKCRPNWSDQSSRMKKFFRTVRQRILPRLSALIRWFTLFLDYPPNSYLPSSMAEWKALQPLLNIGYFFCSLYGLGDAEITKEVARNPDCVDLTARIWLLQYKEVPESSVLFSQSSGGYFTFVHWDPLDQGTCPLTTMMSSCVFVPESRELFTRNWNKYCVKKFGFGADPLQIMAISLLSRIRQITESNETGSSYYRVAERSLHNLATVMNWLQPSQEGYAAIEHLGRPVSDALDQQSFVYHTLQCVASLCDRITPERKPSYAVSPETVLFCIDFIRDFPLRWSTYADCRAIPRVCDLIRGGILHTISTAIDLICQMPSELRVESNIDAAKYFTRVQSIWQKIEGYHAYHPVRHNILKYGSPTRLSLKQRSHLGYAGVGTAGASLRYDRGYELLAEQHRVWKSVEKGKLGTEMFMCCNTTVSQAVCKRIVLLTCHAAFQYQVIGEHTLPRLQRVPVGDLLYCGLPVSGLASPQGRVCN